MLFSYSSQEESKEIIKTNPLPRPSRSVVQPINCHFCHKHSYGRRSLRLRNLSVLLKKDFSLWSPEGTPLEEMTLVIVLQQTLPARQE